jgi:hypothetical protein
MIGKETRHWCAEEKSDLKPEVKPEEKQEEKSEVSDVQQVQN